MGNLNKHQLKELTELLDSRYSIYLDSKNNNSETLNADKAFYEGICTAIQSIGSNWERRSDGTHYVWSYNWKVINMKRKNLCRIGYGTKVLNHRTGEVNLLIYSWTNTFADGDIDFATCVDRNGKEYSIRMDEISPFEE